MNSLYIDTHASNIVMALYKKEKLWVKKEITEPKEHSTVCIPTLISLLEENKITLDDISDIIVVNGPGSFTGVRLSVTIAKTLSYTKKIPIRTVTSLEIMNFLNVQENYISIPEKNGYFVGKLNQKKDSIIEYMYKTKLEYEEFKKEENIKECNLVDYENIVKYAHTKESINPHSVNPLYVKKIEVEK